ncbi:hypothetical protein BJ166DRAFT_541424 [Pestalotiopsis sp. NC0098]|nr:hypothetical protein BJ166DRAFT_541424 [Pestalotiopsis sp. NC0098]
MSKNVAVAGPGGLGRHVVDALLESKEFNVTVLSRSAKPELEAKGATVKVVDYRYPSQLIAALEGVDTLLSFIVDFAEAKGGPSLGALAHRNLLAAAVSPRVGLKRFVPAEYANDAAVKSVLSCERDKPHFRAYVREFCPARGIEYTLVSNGVLMDFFRPRGDRGGFPGADDGGDVVPLDAENKTALIPGDKGDKISFTAARDVARCVVALLKVEAGGWDEYSYISGDRLTWDEAADRLEGALGEKLARTYVGLEELRARAEQARKAGEFAPTMTAELREIFGDGSEVLPENSRYFEGVKFQKLGDVFEECYGKGARK